MCFETSEIHELKVNEIRGVKANKIYLVVVVLKPIKIHELKGNEIHGLEINEIHFISWLFCFENQWNSRVQK